MARRAAVVVLGAGVLLGACTHGKAGGDAGSAATGAATTSTTVATTSTTAGSATSTSTSARPGGTTTTAPSAARPGGTPTTSSSSTTSTAVIDGTLTLTTADQGRHLTVRVGTRIDVALDGSAPDHMWNEPASNGAAVHRNSGSADATGDASAVFSAAGAGQARLQADQQCPPGHFCAQTDSWFVDVTVVA